MKHRVLISAGGTGGHVFPALALAQQISEQRQDVDILFAAGGLARNRFFPKEIYPFKSYPCATISPRKPWTLPLSCWRIAKGFTGSRSILQDFQPQVVVGFGSYYTLPMLLAAYSLKVPIVLHEQNSLPGKVNKLMSSRALFTGVHFPCSIKELAGNIVEVGMPLRKGFSLGSSTREQASEYFQLDPRLFTLLIFGGSQGAQRLNHVVWEALIQIPPTLRKHLQVIHIVGSPAENEKYQQKYQACSLPVRVKEFESRMDLAWQAADLVISRAGACSIAEQLEFEVPGILVPYPYATDKHQDKNAEFLVNEVGGAIMMQEDSLTASDLVREIIGMMDQAESKRKAMRVYKGSHRQRDLYSLVMEACGL